DFGDKLERLTSEGVFTAALSLHDDETAHLCRWRLPKKHFLEAWSDGFGYDGTAAIQQPLIERMYDGLAPLEFFSMVLGPQETDYDLVRRYWSGRLNGQAPQTENTEGEPGIVVPGEMSDTQIDRLQTELDEIQNRLAELNQAEFDSGSIEEQLRIGNLASLRTERSALLDQITALGLVIGEEDVLARAEPDETAVENEQTPAQARPDRNFEDTWRVALAKGLFENTAAEPIDVNVMPGAAAGINLQPPAEGLEAVFAPDPALYDGRYANNGWLQEMPKPLTQLTWDNAVFMSAQTAEELGLELDFDRGDYPVVRVSVNGTEVEAAAMINMGMADNVLLLHLGHGRWRAGQMGSSPGSFAAGRAMFHERADRGGGFNFYELRTSASPSIATGVSITPTDDYYPLALAQVHHTIDVEKIDSGRHLIQPRTLEQYNNVTPLMHQYHWEKHGEHGGEHGGDHDDHGHEQNGAVSSEIARGNSVSDPPSLYPEEQHDFSDRAYQWAMTIDLNLCTGCSACVVACQAENNIPVVGKREVKVGREMHWLRIDRYYGPSVQQYQKEGDKRYLNIDDPQLYFQPLACVHCENAPCEPVCPVAATIHNHEGVNQMIYNRCVGTRYCSNNCPYKVRRFNYLNYANIHDVPVLKLLHNPNVTVRGRGVMEKCTYCVQRINKARIEAKKDGRKIQDGEVITACQQACPSEAILFGDIRDTNSAVYKAKQDKRNYLLLEDLNTRPRTSHLTKLFNPNPRIEA
ncbi:MAG: 4Fe-4S dicluster domain-containing protein, partial [Fimbriimonadaceae bacterium]